MKKAPAKYALKHSMDAQFDRDSVLSDYLRKHTYQPPYSEKDCFDVYVKITNTCLSNLGSLILSNVIPSGVSFPMVHYASVLNLPPRYIGLSMPEVGILNGPTIESGDIEGSCQFSYDMVLRIGFTLEVFRGLSSADWSVGDIAGYFRIPISFTIGPFQSERGLAHYGDTISVSFVMPSELPPEEHLTDVRLNNVHGNVSQTGLNMQFGILETALNTIADELDFSGFDIPVPTPLLDIAPNAFLFKAYSQDSEDGAQPHFLACWRSGLVGSSYNYLTKSFGGIYQDPEYVSRLPKVMSSRTNDLTIGFTEEFLRSIFQVALTVSGALGYATFELEGFDFKAHVRFRCGFGALEVVVSLYKSGYVHDWHLMDVIAELGVEINPQTLNATVSINIDAEEPEMLKYLTRGALAKLIENEIEPYLEEPRLEIQAAINDTIGSALELLAAENVTTDFVIVSELSVIRGDGMLLGFNLNAPPEMSFVAAPPNARLDLQGYTHIEHLVKSTTSTLSELEDSHYRWLYETNILADECKYSEFKKIVGTNMGRLGPWYLNVGNYRIDNQIRLSARVAKYQNTDEYSLEVLNEAGENLYSETGVVGESGAVAVELVPLLARSHPEWEVVPYPVRRIDYVFIVPGYPDKQTSEQLLTVEHITVNIDVAGYYPFAASRELNVFTGYKKIDSLVPKNMSLLQELLEQLRTGIYSVPVMQEELESTIPDLAGPVYYTGLPQKPKEVVLGLPRGSAEKNRGE